MRTFFAIAVAIWVASCLPSLEPEPSLELGRLGSLIAAEWDGVNGVPVEVRLEVECMEYWGECDPGLGHHAPPHAVSAMISAFSETLEVPLLEGADAEAGPQCPWSESPRPDGRQGLQAQFLEPQIVGDSARVVVFSRCAAPDRRMGGFRQAHEFVFSRDESGLWTLVSRQLVFIT